MPTATLTGGLLAARVVQQSPVYAGARRGMVIGLGLNKAVHNPGPPPILVTRPFLLVSLVGWLPHRFWQRGRVHTWHTGFNPGPAQLLVTRPFLMVRPIPQPKRGRVLEWHPPRQFPYHAHPALIVQALAQPRGRGRAFFTRNTHRAVARVPRPLPIIRRATPKLRGSFWLGALHRTAPPPTFVAKRGILIARRREQMRGGRVMLWHPAPGLQRHPLQPLRVALWPRKPVPGRVILLNRPKPTVPRHPAGIRLVALPWTLGRGRVLQTHTRPYRNLTTHRGIQIFARRERLGRGCVWLPRVPYANNQPFVPHIFPFRQTRPGWTQKRGSVWIGALPRVFTGTGGNGGITILTDPTVGSIGRGTSGLQSENNS